MDQTISRSANISSRSDNISTVTTLCRFALVVSAYYAFGWFGLQYANIVSNITLIWLPTGIAVAALFRWGMRLAPAIYTGAFLVNITFNAAVPLAAGIALGNTLGPILTVSILNRFNFDAEFRQKREFGLYTFASMLGMQVPAIGGVFLQWCSGNLSSGSVVFAWTVWWAGDLFGILLASTLLLSLSRKNIERATSQPLDAALYGVVFIALLALLFVSHPSLYFYPCAVVIAAFLLLIVLKYGAFWTSLSIVILVLLAVVATAAGHTPFELNDPGQSFLLLWSYTAIVIVFCLMVLAADAESKAKSASLNWQERALGAISQGVVVTGVDRVITYVNDGFEKITGYTRAEIAGTTGSFLHGPETSPKTVKEIQDALGSWRSFSGEILNYRKDGSVFCNDLSISPVFDNSGAVIQFIGVQRDITVRKQLERELRIAAIALEAQEGIVITDSAGGIIKINKAFSRITGFEPDEVLSKTPAILNSGHQNQAFYEAMWKALKLNGRWQGEIWNKRKSGEVYPEYLTISAVKDSEGVVENYVGIFTDISFAKDAESTIRRLAFYDTLTNLPNRRLFLDRLNQSLIASARHSDYGALLYIDLDDFKMVNDLQGHGVGDRLLVEVARRLELCVRSGDTVARLGGDEFVVLLEEVASEEEHAAKTTERIAEKILTSLQQPFHFDTHECHISSSVGISLIHNHDASADDVLARADSAMYQAKKCGRNTLRFYDPLMQEALLSRVQMAAMMRSSLGRHFLLYFQVQVDRSGKAVGAEALIRWQHPEKGMISPVEFIPLAEDNGMIVEIGQWVLETACAQLKAWEGDAHFRHLQLAINVSSRQFQQNDYVQRVLTTLKKHDLKPPHCLKLELTESAVLKDVDETISKMAALKAAGIRFSMDDFGTGYSSLAYLTQFKFDQIKIDKSFVLNMQDEISNKVVVQTIIGMGHNLGMEVIAEGVETADQLVFLLANKCDAFQGYKCGKPLPLEEFTQCIRRENANQVNGDWQ